TLVETLRDDPNRLGSASWNLVSQPSANVVSYRQALRWAEAASRLQATNAFWLNTVGAVQYRLAKHTEALETLKRAETLLDPGKGGAPYNWASVAMTPPRLGQRAPALAALDRCYVAMRRPPWSGYTDCQALLREAGELIESPPEREARRLVESLFQQLLL